MAPRELPKATPKVQRTISKNSKPKSSPITTIKKTIATKKVSENTPLKVKNALAESRQRTKTVPKMSTPKPKENKSNSLPETVAKSAKKANWKRRPKPAHSGVPVPEKMKKLLGKQLEDSDCSF